MMRLLHLGCFLALSGVLPLFAQPITTAADAIRRANRLTGLETVSGPPSAALTKIRRDVTPFLGERNTGKPAWRVGYRKSGGRTFIVMLEPAGGHLLYITSIYGRPPDPDMRPMPSSSVATRQLRGDEEIYAGYPDQDPKVNFVTALELILSEGVGSPLLAKEIFADYVLHSKMGSNPQPVWAITLRGLPPRPVRSPSVPAWQRNHMRNVVDAITGKVLFATNSPQPQ